MRARERGMHENDHRDDFRCRNAALRPTSRASVTPPTRSLGGARAASVTRETRRIPSPCPPAQYHRQALLRLRPNATFALRINRVGSHPFESESRACSCNGQVLRRHWALSTRGIPSHGIAQPPPCNMVSDHACTLVVVLYDVRVGTSRCRRAYRTCPHCICTNMRGESNI